MSSSAAGSGSPEFEYSLLINAAPTRVLMAFFDPVALAAWWQVARSVTTPRAMGVFAVEWPPTADSDEVLGRLGGVFRGTVMQFEPGHGFFVADCYWLPPDGDPIGPMALEVTCRMSGPACRLQVKQTGFEENPRWRRYYEVVGNGWERALASLRSLLEK